MLKNALTHMGDTFTPATLRNALSYEEQGRVLMVRLSDGLLKGRVKGTSNQLCDVFMDLKTWPNTASRCSCGAAQCDHAAACLFYLANKARTPHAVQVPDALPAPARFVVHAETSLEEGVHTSNKLRVNWEHLEWFSDLKTQSHDFFSYRLGVYIEGHALDLLPLMTALIHQYGLHDLENMPDTHQITWTLPSGMVLCLAFGRLKPLLRILLQYGMDPLVNTDGAALSRHQLLLLQEAEQALSAVAFRWLSHETLRKQLQGFEREHADAVSLPKGLQATLRDYQWQGLCWLQRLRECGFGGVLADDMGLGKTVQTLAHLLLEKEQGRLTKACLIIAPTSLVMNWFEEAKRFTPDLRVLIFHGQRRHAGSFDEYDLVVSTYGLIQRDKRRFMAYTFYYVILDEAQYIKNARAKTTLVIQQLKAVHRLCLTGTPLENHLGELWSLFHFLIPGLLGDPKQFRRYFKDPIEFQNNKERQALLVGRVRPFMLRRNKEEVARELPEKTEIIQWIELSGAQRDLYETLRISMAQKVREAISAWGFGRSRIVLLDALLKLRQVCCDPRLLTLPAEVVLPKESAKREACMALITELVNENRCILVFSQFTSMLALLEKELLHRNIAYLKLTGQTRDRHLLVEQFQQGLVPVFLISLKAGGVGLNLTRADTVIHYDPWWNPAAEDQATDRSHRIGQNKPVFVYKLVVSSTVESAILDMQTKKRALFEGILSNNAAGMDALTPADVEQFFKPLE